MKLQNITLNPNATSEVKKPLFGLNGMKSLSKAEDEMITKTFPKEQSLRLDLYLSSGTSKTEIPNAKGQKLDFRV